MLQLLLPFSPVLCFVLAFAIAALPVFKHARLSEGHSRFKALDGLRGYLAIAVVIHHSRIYAVFLAPAQGVAPASVFRAVVGPLGVEFFFLIPAYLFWGKVIAGDVSFP